MIAFFLFKQKTAYEMRISDWSSDVCSSDLRRETGAVDDRVDAMARAVLHFDAVFDDAPHWCVDEFDVVACQRREPGVRQQRAQIGRASCRERVCQYV